MNGQCTVTSINIGVITNGQQVVYTRGNTQINVTITNTNIDGTYNAIESNGKAYTNLPSSQLTSNNGNFGSVTINCGSLFSGKGLTLSLKPIVSSSSQLATQSFSIGETAKYLGNNATVVAVNPDGTYNLSINAVSNTYNTPPNGKPYSFSYNGESYTWNTNYDDQWEGSNGDELSAVPSSNVTVTQQTANTNFASSINANQLTKMTVTGISLPPTLQDKIQSSSIESAVDDAINQSEIIINQYPQESANSNVQTSANPTYGETVLSSAINLADEYQKFATEATLITKFISLYPSSSLASSYQQKLDSLYHVDSSLASNTIYLNNQYHTINLVSLSAPTSQASATFSIGTSLTTTSLQLRGPAVILPNGAGNVSLYSLTASQAIVSANCQQGINTQLGSLTQARTQLQMITFNLAQQSAQASQTVCGIPMFLSNINMQQLAQIKLIPNADNTQSAVNLTVGVGIEKRAIQLSPAKTEQAIVNLNASIAKWQSISTNLGNVVSGLQGACFATSAILTVKSFLDGINGAGIARQQVMGGTNGWDVTCQQMVAQGTYKDLNTCYNANSDSIASDVTVRTSAINQVNSQLASIPGCQSQSTNTLSSLFGSPSTVDQTACANAYYNHIVSTYGSNQITLANGTTTTVGQMLALQSGQGYQNGTYTLDQLKTIELSIQSEQASGASSSMINNSNSALQTVYQQINNNKALYSQVYQAQSYTSKGLANPMNLGTKTQQTVYANLVPPSKLNYPGLSFTNPSSTSTASGTTSAASNANPPSGQPYGFTSNGENWTWTGSAGTYTSGDDTWQGGTVSASAEGISNVIQTNPTSTASSSTTTNPQSSQTVVETATIAVGPGNYFTTGSAGASGNGGKGATQTAIPQGTYVVGLSQPNPTQNVYQVAQLERINPDNSVTPITDQNFINQFVNTEGLAGGIASQSQVSYNNKYLNPQVTYYETAPYKGMPAIVPFDIQHGWYAATQQTTAAFGAQSSFDSSGRVSSFWLCNVGPNGIQQFNQGLGDDICELINLNSGQPINQFPNLSPQQAQTLVTEAIQALNSAATQYGSGNGPVKIPGVDQPLQRGAPAANIPSTQCTDFMSPGDCDLLFNVCDPVICPSSRCNLGGAYPVANVVQTGIIGSLVLCLPNFGNPANGGVAIPICLSGLNAGIQNYISVLTASRDCLQNSLNTGSMVGICDEITSIYTCQFFWNQIAPFANLILPKIVELAYNGGQAQGGGEYMTVMGAWQNTQNEINYLTNTYAVNALTAYNIRSIQDVGTTFCDSFISASVPTNVKSLLQPQSPPQFSAWFSSTPFSSATVPATSQYNVYYHIYGGTDAGTYFNVYLESSQNSGYYYLSPTLTVDSGYLAPGQSADQTKDFTAPTGYQQLCVNINGQAQCGFGQVSTSFGLNYLSDSYAASEINQTNINSQQGCISGSPSAGGLLTSPNIQTGVTNAVTPQNYNSGITRICSTQNPGLTTNPTRYVNVGNCGNSNVICWLDTNSVNQAISASDVGIKNATLSSLQAIQQQQAASSNAISSSQLSQYLDSESVQVTSVENAVKSSTPLYDCSIRSFWKSFIY